MKKKLAGRPKKEPEEVLVDLPSKVAPSTLEAVEQIAGQLDRPRGWVARRLLMRGVEVYLRDVQIMRPEDAIQEPSERPENANQTSMAAHKTNPKLIQSTRKKRGNIDKAIEVIFSFTGKPPSDADIRKIREIFEEEQGENSDESP